MLENQISEIENELKNQLVLIEKDLIQKREQLKTSNVRVSCPFDVTEKAKEFEDINSSILKLNLNKKNIENALKRIKHDSENYGYCEECGNDISIGRLKAIPHSTLCVECKNVQELEDKQYA